MVYLLLEVVGLTPKTGQTTLQSHGHPCWFIMCVVSCSGHIVSAAGGWWVLGRLAGLIHENKYCAQHHDL